MVALPALHAARLLGVPFCYEVRGLWEITRASHTAGYKQSEHFKLFERMEGFVAQQADLTYAITKSVRAELGRRGVFTDRVRIAPNGCDTTRFAPQPPDLGLAAELGIAGQMVFGYIGSFMHYEGIQDLCQAAVNLHSCGLEFRLILVGDGPDWAAVKNFVDNHDHGGKILLLGRVPFQDVPRYYSLIKVAVFPRKSFEITEMVSPLKPFEAMAMGKPVIGSDVAAIAEIIRDGQTGWLFSKNDVAALTAAMAHAVSAPEAVTSSEPLSTSWSPAWVYRYGR
jgi:glycosyltransferase involved in cell wall biosynthesis